MGYQGRVQVIGEVVERCENDVVCFRGSLW